MLPKSHPPAPSSPEVEDDTNSGSQEEEESSYDEEQTPAPSPPPKPQTQNKRKMSQRIWIPIDEAVVLLEMIDYEMWKGKDVEADMKAFTEVVNRVLHFGLSSTQLKDEILRIKKKFKRRYKKDKNKTFPNELKQKVFNLSRVIWGEETFKGNAEKSNAEARKRKEKTEKKSTAGGGRGKKKVEDVEFEGGKKRAKMKEKWKQLEVQEHELYKKKRAMTKLMIADLDD